MYCDDYQMALIPILFPPERCTNTRQIFLALRFINSLSWRTFCRDLTRPHVHVKHFHIVEYKNSFSSIEAGEKFLDFFWTIHNHEGSPELGLDCSLLWAKFRYSCQSNQRKPAAKKGLKQRVSKYIIEKLCRKFESKCLDIYTRTYPK